MAVAKPRCAWRAPGQQGAYTLRRSARRLSPLFNAERSTALDDASDLRADLASAAPAWVVGARDASG